MDDQRRYELNRLADHLDKLVAELNELAHEEQARFNNRPSGSALSVSGEDSKEAFEQMHLSAGIISNEAELLRHAAKKRPPRK